MTSKYDLRSLFIFESCVVSVALFFIYKTFIKQKLLVAGTTKLVKRFYLEALLKYEQKSESKLFDENRMEKGDWMSKIC